MQRNFANWVSIYCALPTMGSDLLRGISKAAGVHLYADQDVILDANNKFLMIHHDFDAPQQVHIQLPQKVDIYDPFMEKTVQQNTDHLDIELQEGKTYFYELK